MSLTRSDFDIEAKSDIENRPPDTSSSDVKTVVTVPDGRTIILGGMLKLNQSKTVKQVPGLGKIPVLGALFRGSSAQDQEKHLYIFVKAEIIRPAEFLHTGGGRHSDLMRLSERDRAAFDEHERAFQNFRSPPGKSTSVRPTQVPEPRSTAT